MLITARAEDLSRRVSGNRMKIGVRSIWYMRDQWVCWWYTCTTRYLSILIYYSLHFDESALWLNMYLLDMVIPLFAPFTPFFSRHHKP